MPILEICVDDSAGLREAIAGGADRIELCSALELGGLTPSAALLEQALQTDCPTHMMIRPRAGGFVLVEGEAALMVEEIRIAGESSTSTRWRASATLRGTPRSCCTARSIWCPIRSRRCAKLPRSAMTRS